MKFLLCIMLTLFGAGQALAQPYTINGVLRDAIDESTFPNVTVILINAADSSVVRETVSYANGSFELDDIGAGNYLLQAQYLGYQPAERAIELNEDTDIGVLYLHESATALDEVTIDIRPPVGKQQGDTTQFNAGAFQTMKDANAQILIEKLPGMGSEDGTLQAQGENIVQILVDGKPFFGTDVNAALQNLPAEIIESVQIYDRMSDKAELSGFDDGEREKTINIITKPNSRRGLFGKASAGYGDGDRYLTGVSLNAFNEDRRITITGLSNNVNATSYSADPNSQGESRPQNGIITTNRVGIDFSDDWGEKIEINASYLFNQRQNIGEAFTNREYVLPGNEGQVYTENSTNTRRNNDHRFNMRFEYNIDSNNRILIRPNLSAQFNREESFFSGVTFTPEGTLNETENLRMANDRDIDFVNRIFYSRRFAKKGRSLTVNLRTGNYFNKDNADRQADIVSFGPDERIETLDQNITRIRKGFSWQSGLSYTEPVGQRGMIELEYEIGNDYNDSDQRLYDIDELTGNPQLDPALSNTFNSQYIRQEAEIGYQYSLNKLRVQVEAEYQHARLKNDQEFPIPFELQRTFQAVMPSVRLNYRFTDSRNLQFDYDARTNAPSVGDLQAVIDNSNPLHLRTGNPDLQQSYSNRLRMRYRSYTPQSQQSFFAMVQSSFISNNVVNSTTIAEEPTEIADGVVLERGAQLSRPVNLDGYWNINSFFNWGMPLGFIPSNFNFHGGIRYSRSPGVINGEQNFVRNTRYSGGVSLSSNISDRIDFNIWTRSSYNTVDNSLRPALSTNFFNQQTRINYNWIFWKDLIYRLDINHQLNSGLSEGYDASIFLVNMAIGKKLLPNERGEISVNVYDLFGQNNNIRRNISEAYIEDRRSNVLQRYVMLSFTYNIRHFSRGTTMKDYEELYSN